MTPAGQQADAAFGGKRGRTPRLKGIGVNVEEKKPKQFLKDFFTRGEEVEFFMNDEGKWVQGIVKYDMRSNRLYQIERPNGDLFLVAEHWLRRVGAEK